MFYSENTYWKKYQDFYPKDMRYSNNNYPDEEYWIWKENKIHIDRKQYFKSKCKVILLHGSGGNGRMLAPLGVFFSNNEIDYVAPDLPGYGLSKIKDITEINYEMWIELVCDLIDYELSKDNKPIILFGLSMGGLLAYQVCCKNKKVAGLIVTNLLDVREQTVKDSISRNIIFSRVGGFIINKIGVYFDNMKVPIKKLCKMKYVTNNKEHSKLLLKDRLAAGNWVTLKFIRTFFNLKIDIEPEQFNVCPVLLIHPGLDKMTPIELSKSFFQKIAIEKKFIELENSGHYPLEEPGVSQMKDAILEFIQKI